MRTLLYVQLRLSVDCFALSLSDRQYCLITTNTLPHQIYLVGQWLKWSVEVCGRLAGAGLRSRGRGRHGEEDGVTMGS